MTLNLDQERVERAAEAARLCLRGIDGDARVSELTRGEVESVCRAAITAYLGDTHGEPVEVRYQNDAIDEICAHGCDLHMEQLSGSEWFIGVVASDGSYSQFWIGARNSRSLVDACLTETVHAEERNAMFSATPAGKER